jgi:hypothetical protein
MHQFPLLCWSATWVGIKQNSLDGSGGYAGHTQKNKAASKLNKKFTSHPTWAQHALLATETVRVSLALQQFACHAYCGAEGPVSKMASRQEKVFCVLRFEVSRSAIIVQREFRARLKKKRIIQK